MRVFLTLLYYDLLQALRQRGDFLYPVLFFLMVLILFPLSVTPDPALLRTMAPGIIWVAALLSSLLGLSRLFAPEYADGTLEQMMLSPKPLTYLILPKIIAHWLLTGLPLILVAPVAALCFHLNFIETKILILSLLLGTPILSLLGAITVALTLSINRSGLLLALLVLPLSVPILIFGAGSVALAMAGLGAGGMLWLLAAILVFLTSTGPVATATALRNL